MTDGAGKHDEHVSAHSITVTRRARYHTLGDLDGSPREVWFACHGYGQLAGRFIRQLAALDNGTRLIVAPEALSRFYIDPLTQRRQQASPRIGATWMTSEDREAEIADYISYLDALSSSVLRRVKSEAPRIVVLGFSQGTATVCRWLGTSAVRAHHLVLWAGTIPPELDLRRWYASLGATSITYVAGDADELVPPSVVTTEISRLDAAAVPFTLQRYSGGHVVDAATLLALCASFDALASTA